MFIVKVERTGKVVGKSKTTAGVNKLIREFVNKQLQKTKIGFDAKAARMLNEMNEAEPGIPYCLYLDECADVRFDIVKK